MTSITIRLAEEKDSPGIAVFLKRHGWYRIDPRGDKEPVPLDVLIQHALLFFRETEVMSREPVRKGGRVCAGENGYFIGAHRFDFDDFDVLIVFAGACRIRCLVPPRVVLLREEA